MIQEYKGDLDIRDYVLRNIEMAPLYEHLKKFYTHNLKGTRKITKFRQRSVKNCIPSFSEIKNNTRVRGLLTKYFNFILAKTLQKFAIWC
jgi:hypothetical protein